MKKILLLLTLSVFVLSCEAQFIFKNGKSTAKADTLASITDTLYLVNKTTGAKTKAVFKAGKLVFPDDVFPKSLKKWTAVTDTFVVIKYLSSNVGVGIETNGGVGFAITANNGTGYQVSTNNGTAILLGNNVGTGISGLGAGKLIEYSGTSTGPTIALDQSGGGLNELYTKDFGTEVYRLDADGNLTTTGTVTANKIISDSIDGPLGSLYLGTGIVALPGEVLWLNSGLTANISHSAGHIKITDPSINGGAETNLSDLVGGGSSDSSFVKLTVGQGGDTTIITKDSIVKYQGGIKVFKVDETGTVLAETFISDSISSRVALLGDTDNYVLIGSSLRPFDLKSDKDTIWKSEGATGYAAVLGDGSVISNGVTLGTDTTEWGNIPGTLSSQTDLWNIIDTTSEWVSRTIYVSMPEDAQTPGSDIIGLGLIFAPYATLNKALSTVNPLTLGIITMQVDSGSYTFDATSKYYCNKISSLNPLTNHSSNLIINGTYVKENYTFTLSSTPVSGVFKSSYAFTTGELTGKFAGTTTTPGLPIESNIGDSLFLPTTNAASFNNIYTYQTNINVSASRYNTSFASQIKFSFLKMNFTIGSNFDNVWSYCCDITNTSASQFGFVVEYCQLQFSIFNMSYSATLAAIDLRNSITSQCVINNKGTRKTTGEGLNIKTPCQISSMMISGYLRAIGSYGDMNNYKAASATWFIIKDCGSAFSNLSFPSSNLNFACNPLALYKVDNIVYASGITSANLSFTTLQNIGSYNYFHTSSSLKSFVKPEWGVNIYIPNTYPEYSQNNSYTLADNSTDSISIADLTYNRTVTIDYNIVRNGVYRAGTMKVLNDGTNYYFDPGDFFPAANDLGITFNGVYKSGSTNTLKLKWTTTSTGFAGTMKVDYKRQNF